VTGFVVVRNGYIIHERYFHEDYGRTGPVRVRSVTKSVTGALIGIALEEGYIESLDQPIGELIPDKIPDGADPLTPTITVRNLLTMTAGWQWDIGSDYPRLIASENWLEYTLSQPVVHQPGTYYAYNSGGSHVLSVILTEVTGQDTADYAQEKLFTPMGIKRPVWQRSPQDEAVGGFGLELTARQMSKFGYLFLNRGRWDQEQLVPADYVDAATTYQSEGDSTGLANYGYQWWVTQAYGMPTYFALGFGSQYLYVAPDRDLVVVVVKGFDDPPAVVTASRPLIENYVLAAAAPQ
jgi:CubicO group peptidase (beta-lactamase class C family)